MHCAVLEGRAYLPEVIQLSKKLCDDPNYYVIHMGTHALSQIAKNRLTVLPSDKDTLFLNDDKKVALELSKQIEGMAFSLLKRYMTWPFSVQEAMAKSILHILSPIRALNQKDALFLVNSLSKFPDEAKKEASHLFIYFAEFREDDYKNWKFKQPNLYDDLEGFDSRPFKIILSETIENFQKNDPDHCFQIAASFERLIRDIKIDDENYEEYTRLALKYFDLLSSVYGHSIFGLIYRVIQDKIENPDKYIDQWYDLFIKCLKTENAFYEARKASGEFINISWYPSMYHSKILELIHEKLGFSKFIEASDIFFHFPEGLCLNESEKMVSIYESASNSVAKAKDILEILIKRDPSKYWYLNKILKKSDN
jgi:hypothetical protein